MQTTPSTVAICLLIALVCAACSTDTGLSPAPVTAALSEPSQTAPPTATAALAATQTSTPQPTASPTRPTPTETGALPTETALAAAIPGDWRVPVVDLSEWGPQAYGSLEWAGPDSLSFDGQDHRIHIVSAKTGDEVAVMKPTPDPDASGENVSAAQEYQVLCRSDGLQMIHTADKRSIAEAALGVEDCVAVVWASDGQAAAIQTDDGEVYLWLTDGSAPRKLGQAARAWNSYPAWSADDRQILLLNNLAGVRDATLASFSIAYRDGRSLFSPNTPIEFGNGWGGGNLEWVTNTLIRNRISGMAYSYHDYYDARTGRFIIRNTITENTGRQASISPDERFLVLQAAQRDTVWKDRWYPFMDSENFEAPTVIDPEMTRPGLMVVNLDTLRRSLVIQAGLPQERVDYYSDSLKYLDWNGDSSKFFFIHFPLGFPDYDLPTGLLALYPGIGYIEPVVPGAIFGSISSDGEHMFAVTAETIGEERADGLTAAIYRTDGKPVTALQRLPGPVEYFTLNLTEVYSNDDQMILSEWSPDGSRLVYADTGGSLWILDTAGNTTQLAANLPKESWDGKAIFSWSPNGQYLLIKSKEYAWIADISAGQRFPGAMKYYYCSTLVEGSEGTRESPYDCGNDVKVSNVVEIVCKQGGGTLYVHHAGMTSNFYEVLLISPNCQVQKKGEFEGSPPSH